MEKQNWIHVKHRPWQKRIACFLAVIFVLGGFMVFYTPNTIPVNAVEAGNVITSMDYFSANDGPVLTNSGVGEASYGFVMPLFNGGEAGFNDISNDLLVLVKHNGTWTDIDSVAQYVYNSNWGHWNDGGFTGYWFVVSQTAEVRLQSKANTGVMLDYRLEFTNLDTTTITSMSATQGPEIEAGFTGSCGFTYPNFNGDSTVVYDQVKDDLDILVWSHAENNWVALLNNAASGWIYDQNFGMFFEGGGGLWFTLEETTRVRLQSKSSPDIFLDYTLICKTPVRDHHILSADETRYTAGETGAIGIPLPKIDGEYPVGAEIDLYVLEVNVNGNWVPLGDSSASSYIYQANGYNDMSDRNQWGYWVDYIYGLWFQPVQEDMELRIGFPRSGEKNGPIDGNYVVYTFIGNPDAPRPDVSDLGNIDIGTSNNANLDGWNLIWNDEFDGNSLNMEYWNYDTGYFIGDNPDHWGWGNAELEYYTDSDKNVFVADGKLNLKAYYEPTTFPEIDPDRVAEYSSGKITTKDKFAFTYGRIDFSAKLPKGTGIWPALWMLPNEDKYGAWASSGEIDIMEARGRLPGSTSGAIHYGGVWPANTHSGNDYFFKDGATFDTDFHVYSLVWEEGILKWYVDGECFYKSTSEQWFSLGAPGNHNAPFDQDFYIIMNLAVGGWFDGGLTPDIEKDIPATMQVDYVRVYKPTE